MKLNNRLEEVQSAGVSKIAHSTQSCPFVFATRTAGTKLCPFCLPCMTEKILNPQHKLRTPLRKQPRSPDIQENVAACKRLCNAGGVSQESSLSVSLSCSTAKVDVALKP